MRDTWTYSATNLNAGGPNSCHISNTQIRVQSHSGTNFSGRYDYGIVVCTGPGLNDTFPVGSGTVIAGAVINGDSVRFNFDDADWRHYGRLVADTMTGLVNLTLTINGSAQVAAGTWRAVRQ